jgi:hypothetical protein
MMRRLTRTTVSIATIIAAIAGIVLTSCRNPFFPPTGRPDRAISLRATPDGVIQQLIQAYEQKNIYLYTDLFPVGNTFQFYVSPQFVNTYLTRAYSSDYPPEPHDTALQFISKFPYYYYWGQAREIAGHRRLFNGVDAIQFLQQPYIKDIRYVVADAGGVPDTTNIELRLVGGQFQVDVLVDTYIDQYTVDIDEQVFWLERDAARLWVIRKWYDFGKDPSN